MSRIARVRNCVVKFPSLVARNFCELVRDQQDTNAELILRAIVAGVLPSAQRGDIIGVLRDLHAVRLGGVSAIAEHYPKLVAVKVVKNLSELRTGVVAVAGEVHTFTVSPPVKPRPFDEGMMAARAGVQDNPYVLVDGTGRKERAWERGWWAGKRCAFLAV